VILRKKEKSIEISKLEKKDIFVQFVDVYTVRAVQERSIFQNKKHRGWDIL